MKSVICLLAFIFAIHIINDLNDVACFSVFSTKAGMQQAAAHPDFDRSEGAAGQRRRAALLPAPPDF